MNVSCAQISKDFQDHISEAMGDLDIFVKKRVSPHLGCPGSLIFVDTERACQEAVKSQANAIVVNPRFLDQIRALPDPKAVLVSSNVPLAMAKITRSYFWKDPHKPYLGHQIHPSAVISPKANIGAASIIGPNTFIDDGVTIGTNTFIGANCIIEEGAQIGSHCHLYPLVYIGPFCQIGSECIIQTNTSIGTEGYGFASDSKGHHHRIPQTGPVIIEDRVEIGANCAIDRGTIEETRIGEGTKIDNLCHIAHNLQIGKNGFITAGFVVAGSTTIGDNFACGGHTSVNGHISITDNVQLAGRSVVQQSVKSSGVFGGHPLQPLKDYLRTTSCLEHLVQMRKNLAKILK